MLERVTPLRESSQSPTPMYPPATVRSRSTCGRGKGSEAQDDVEEDDAGELHHRKAHQ